MSSRIEQIIDEIELYIDSCKFQPLSSTKIIVNKEELDELIQELRKKTPEEIKRYQKIISNKEAILADAQARADQIIAQAHIQTNELVSEHQIMQQAYAQANEIVELATKQAQEILDNATMEANSVRAAAMQYMDDILNYLENLIVNTGAARQKQPTGLSSIDDEGHERFDDYLYMNGGAIFNFTLEAVPAMMKQVLEKNGIEKDNIDYYVFHQANKFMLNTIRKVCVLSKDKFYINLENTGNTVSSTVMIALKDCIEEGKISAGMNVMITGFGVGLSWGGTILKF